MRRVLAQPSFLLAALSASLLALLLVLLPALLGMPALGARAASAAGGNNVEGRGFDARLPAGFRPAGSQEEGSGSQRSFRRRVDSGELRLTFSSCEQADAAFAALEMQLGAAFDGLAALSELEGAEGSTNEVRVSGAQTAHQTVLRGTEGSERTLMARVDRIIVTVTLESPAAADAEAAEAWNSVLASLRVEDSSRGIVTVLLIALGCLTLLSVSLRLLRGGVKQVKVASAPAGYAPARPDPPSAAPIEAYHPSPLPTQATSFARRAGAGFSRADDGFVVFDAEAKARGASDLTLKLSEVRRRAPPAPPTPARVPNLKPPTPAIRI